MTAADRVYQIIKKRILNGQYPAGSYVREATIGQELELSRTPIREALRRLVSDGWVEAIPHHGARVVAWTQHDVEEVFELRVLLEPQVVRRAASRITAERLETLEALAARMDALCEQVNEAAVEEIAELNDRFHAELVAAADSPRLQRLLETIVQVPVSRRSFHHYTCVELRGSMQHHRELIRALGAGDGEWAASVMRAHILAARAAQLRPAPGEEMPEPPRRRLSRA
ncbi:GntR family transcriptional regulator [Billgrantia tianxiuensis]|jgi:DNA-binding GntR family transcriptional regulator|uniref:GntR family transcriptional regulator n=1 Tax=Billgrantia tianxiuensis TaxID=2497861 RepID=A0A6I6SKZ8_9GAMM|nr:MULTISPECIES: GntR family transcriptional regulator [Halomonas]MCE8033685.1 GntR family transcriptional regulator [Halomonas sp. MCCC 1A11057]QHC51269.1 GntR family transcriptional regulator [Halomonas tianxiuensis]